MHSRTSHLIHIFGVTLQGLKVFMLKISINCKYLIKKKLIIILASPLKVKFEMKKIYLHKL